MANYQDEFRCILDEEVSDYAERALGLLAQATQARSLVLTEELFTTKVPRCAGCRAAGLAHLGRE